jgi:hypothetical protein
MLFGVQQGSAVETDGGVKIFSAKKLRDDVLPYEN